MIGFSPISGAPIGYSDVSAPVTPPVTPGEGGELIAVCIATIMSARPINLQAAMSSAAINLTVSF